LCGEKKGKGHLDFQKLILDQGSTHLLSKSKMRKKSAPPRRYLDGMKTGFFKGLGIGLGLLTTSLFAAATALNVFSSGETLSSSKINFNFSIAAPEGLIAPFYLDTCPNGWAPADGTNGTPDLRGLFVRGRDNVGTGAAGNDPSGIRAIGNLQADAFQGHQHTVDGTSAGGSGINVNGVGGIGLPTTSTVSDGSNGTPRTSNETRPKNVALTYCMRKN
jgi:hypothetical protein